MDTSKQYIKMRVSAIPELGMGTSPEKSPPCFITDNVWVDAVGNWYLISNSVIGCQLERQDQLQEMVISEQKPMFALLEMINNFNVWYLGDAAKETLQFTSMEQLWLSFVMKEKFGKTWDGEKWIDGK